jgi:hypothetical protein
MKPYYQALWALIGAARFDTLPAESMALARKSRPASPASARRDERRAFEGSSAHVLRERSRSPSPHRRARAFRRRRGVAFATHDVPVRRPLTRAVHG